MTVPLPEAGDGSRRRRRGDRRRRTQRSAARTVAIAVAVAIVAGLGWVVVDLLGDDDPGSERAASTTPPSDEPPALVLLRAGGADGDIYGVTILAPATATIVHIPPGTLVEVPSLGLASLHDAGRDGDDELVRQSLENLLGIRFASVVTLTSAALAEQVDLVGPLTVTLTEAVEGRTEAGRVTVLLPAGEQTVDPSNAETFLSVTGTGTALDRLVRHQTFWSAWLDAAEVEGEPDAVTAMLGLEVRQRVLPVEVVGGTDADEELYRIRGDDLRTLVASAFPGAAGADVERIRVRILNGAGVPGVAQQVQPLLVDVGAEVTLSGNADRFDYPTTQVVYYDDALLDEARAIVAALGVGEVVKSLNGLAVVDVTVVVGADFLAAHPEEDS